MRVNAKIMHAFSVNETGGNPAGVVLNADELSNELKQVAAKSLGYPETAFVSRSAVAEFKLDFFTPNRQIPHCGHATIATFTYLKKHGFIGGSHSSKETIDGTREIFFKDGLAYMEQRRPATTFVDDELNSIMNSLNLAPDDLLPGKSPAIVNTGNSFLMVPLKNEKILASIEPDLDAISRISEPHNLIGFYPFALVPNSRIQATTRMFGPFYGIPEEAATGMAAGPLACFLFSTFGMIQPHFEIEQGRFIRPASSSMLFVDLVLNGDQIEKLYVGGDAYVSKEVDLELREKGKS
jgi:PhzF family phenazine biosynthesis protein